MAEQLPQPENQQQDQPVPQPRIAAVSLKLPPFWPADPAVWFLQVEAQFTLKGIVQQRTKFDHVIAVLAPEVATEVRDIILNPPGDTPYDLLKAALIKRTEASEQRKLQQLLTAEELGDRKPSQLLRRMQQLLGDAGPPPEGAFVRQLFLQRMPPSVRMVLASASTTLTLLQLAEMADRILEVANPLTSLRRYHLNSQQDRPDRVATSIFRTDMSQPPMNSNTHRSLVAHWGGSTVAYRH